MKVRALNETVELSKRALLFDWFVRLPSVSRQALDSVPKESPGSRQPQDARKNAVVTANLRKTKRIS